MASREFYELFIDNVFYLFSYTGLSSLKRSLISQVTFLVNVFVKGGSPKFDGWLLWMEVRQRTAKQIKKGGGRSKYLVKSCTLIVLSNLCLQRSCESVRRWPIACFCSTSEGRGREAGGRDDTGAKIAVIPHMSCIPNHSHSSSTKGASTLAWFLSKLGGCLQCCLAAKSHFHLRAPGNLQQVFNIYPKRGSQLTLVHTHVVAPLLTAARRGKDPGGETSLSTAFPTRFRDWRRTAELCPCSPALAVSR